MTEHLSIRASVAADVAALATVIAATDLFPADMLGDMIAPYLGDKDCTDIWLTCVRGSRIIGVAFCEAERLTNGTRNLQAIAVLPDCQGRGVGQAMLRFLEATLAAAGDRVLIVETSGLPDYAATRRFYLANGYTEAARIPDFYDAGDDKIVFWRSLRDETRQD